MQQCSSVSATHIIDTHHFMSMDKLSCEHLDASNSSMCVHGVTAANSTVPAHRLRQAVRDRLAGQGLLVGHAGLARRTACPHALAVQLQAPQVVPAERCAAAPSMHTCTHGKSLHGHGLYAALHPDADLQIELLQSDGHPEMLSVLALRRRYRSANTALQEPPHPTAEPESVRAHQADTMLLRGGLCRAFAAHTAFTGVVRSGLIMHIKPASACLGRAR